jgi:hypothetical protein
MAQCTMPLQSLSDVEPVYWRCSKPECNPDGEQGWLKIISRRDPSNIDKVRHLGLSHTVVAERYREALEFDKAILLAIPCSGTVLLFPDQPYTKEACTCIQDYSSVLYNEDRKPIGLLGGLNLLPGRLDVAAWTCCKHYTIQGPMPLKPEHGWTDCPFASDDECKGPCKECYLVNGWDEALLQMHRSKYVNQISLGLLVPTNILPHMDPSIYPRDGPLTEHATHFVELQDTYNLNQVNRDIRRILSQAAAMELDKVCSTDPQKTVGGLVATIRKTRDAWGHY